MVFNKVVVPNIARVLNEEYAWRHVWGLSRAMKKAGWKLLASSDGLSKDTSSDPARDWWSPVEQVAFTQAWQVDDDAGPSFVDITTAIGDATTNDTVLFPVTEAIGDWVALGYSIPFGEVYIDYTSGTRGVAGVIVWEYWNGSAWTALLNVTDTTNGFTAVLGAYQLSFSIPDDWAETSVNSVSAYYIRARITTVYSTNPVIDQALIIKPDEDFGITANSGAAASITTVSEGRAIITGLTGMTNSSKGNFLLLSGAATAVNNNMHQIEEVLSATSVRIDARTFAVVGSDANNGSISWGEIDPTTETVPTRLDAITAWSVWQGPSVLKIPIAAEPVEGPSGFNFIRGENVVQATTSAEGEILGWVYDGVSSGYLVVMPRVIGTGGDTPYGWDTANTITGDTSGATVDQAGTALEFRHQCVLAKDNAGAPDQRGHWYAQVFEPVGESTEDFLLKAQSTGCTPGTQPGAGGTGNSFPTYAWCCNGRNTTTGSTWHGSNSTYPMGNGHAVCMDAIWESGQSSDGTCILLMAHQGGYYACRAFLRLDDTEPGDLTPFATFGISSDTMYTDAGRLQAGQSTSISSTNYMNSQVQDSQSTSHSNFKAWRRRGFQDVEDKYLSCEMLVLLALTSQNSHLPAIEENIGTGENLQTSLVQTRMREPVRIGSINDTHGKMRKVTVRHMTMVQGGTAGQTYDNGKFFQISPTAGAFVVPWDETTLPQPS